MNWAHSALSAPLPGCRRVSVPAPAACPKLCAPPRTGELRHTTFLFLWKSLSWLFPTIFSEVSLCSSFVFGRICHQSLKRVAGCNTRLPPAQKHAVPSARACLAMLPSRAPVLLNENGTLPLPADLWNRPNLPDTAA